MSAQDLRNSLALIHSLANDTTADNWQDKRLYVLQTCVRMSDTIATLEVQLAERVRVKPLEWSMADPGVFYTTTYKADTIIGEYIAQHSCCYFHNALIWPGGRGYGIDEARAAAQADYERRILAALEATPPAPKVMEDPIEALQAIRRETGRCRGAQSYVDAAKFAFKTATAALTASQEPGR